MMAPARQAELERTWPLGVYQVPLWLAAVLLLAAVFHRSSTSRSAITHAADSVPPLGTRECGRASRLRVCSHLAAAAGQPGEAATSGAVQTLAQQYGRGVTCFRLDLLATADGALLATSPERLQQAVPGVRVTDGVAKKKLTELRGAGAAVGAFPTLDKVVETFAGQLRRNAAWTAALDDRPLLMLHLSAFAAGHLRTAAAAAQRHDTAQNVALVVASERQAGELAAAPGGWPGPLVRAFEGNDTVTADSKRLTAAALARYAAVSLSLQLPEPLFQAASRLSKPCFAGPADSDEALRRALDLPGVAGVVFSAPLRMGRLLARWRAACGPHV